jgi:hypothetical protein
MKLHTVRVLPRKRLMRTFRISSQECCSFGEIKRIAIGAVTTVIAYGVGVVLKNMVGVAL